METMMDDSAVIKEISSITGVKYSDEQIAVLKHKGGMCILACAGSGKALKNGTGILTPNGYVPIEKLKIGDICYNDNGEEQEIIGVFPQGKKEIYRVKFSDDTVIDCCKDHLWTYQTYNMRRTTRKWRTDTLEYIRNNVPISVYPHTNRRGESHTRANIYIPMTKAVKFEHKELPIKPYLLGALLGDGGLKSSAVGCSYSFTNNDTDVIDRVNTELQEIGAHLYLNRDHYDIVAGTGYGHNNTESLFTMKLKELGLKDIGSHNKFIPDIYKYSTVSDRLAILQGIIDTDGYCSGTSYELTLASERLIDDVKFIAETLGLTATKSTKIAECVNDVYYKATQVYRLYIKTSDTITKIHWSNRREKQWKTGQTSARRTIVDIVKTGKFEDMTCIKVSGPTGLFLTEHCIVTHNTTVLTHLLAKRIKTGEIKDTSKLLCTTYSKAGQLEMEERLTKLLQRLGVNAKIQVKTLHASYYMILKHFGVNFNICSNSQRTAFVNQACRETGVQLSDEDMQLLDSLLSYQINNLLTDQGLAESYVYTLEDVPIEKYSAIRLLYNKKKEEAGVIDFDDMQLYMYVMLVQQKRPEVVNFCRNLWTDFFIDEFQDVSKIQFAILRELITDPNKLIVIGDDDQCIYQWRGADPNIILNICGYYDIQRFVLSTNYRCGGEIVRHAAVGIKNNAKRSDKTMVPFNEGGKISICDTGHGNLYDMSKVAFTHIKSILDSGEFKIDEIAMLSRNNQHLAIISNMLFDAGMYCNTSAEMRLTNMSMYKDLKNVMVLAENTYNHNIVNSTLWRICIYLGTKGAKIVGDFMNTTGASLKDALGYILTTYARRGGSIDWKGNIKITPKLDAKFDYAYTAVKRESEDSLICIYKTLCKADEVERVTEFFEFYIIATEFMYRSGDRARTISGLVAYFKELIRTKGIQETKSFFRLTEQYESGNMNIPGAKMTMSTMHGSKGREWPHVIIFADDNVTFPSFEGITKMVRDGIDPSDISDSIDEDRRLHYVAMTRAKKLLTIFTNKYNTSVYTLEALGVLKTGGATDNKHIINMALNGGLDGSLINDVGEVVFKQGSQYYYSIDDGKNGDKQEKKVEPSVFMEDDPYEGYNGNNDEVDDIDEDSMYDVE